MYLCFRIIFQHYAMLHVTNSWCLWSFSPKVVGQAVHAFKYLPHLPVCSVYKIGLCIMIIMYIYHDYYYYWSLWYSAILRRRADSLRSHMILHEWIAFYSAFFFGLFFNIHRSGVFTALAWLVPQETAASLSLSLSYTIQPCTMSLHAKPHT